MNRTIRTRHWAWIAALTLAGAGAATAADDQPATKQGDTGAQGKSTTAAQQDTRVKPDKTSGGSGGSSGSRAGTSDTRDWSQIDTDKDGLVSGDEMEKYLQANTNAKK